MHESVLDVIGGTPLIRLGRVGAGLPAPVYLKAEFLNPGMSVKDRAALAMVLAAEKSGGLRPGGTIVESTSGNTGIGLAIVAARRGYQCIAVLPDKTSPDKIAVLRAYGARVVLTPAALPAEHPEHVRNLAQTISMRTPGGWLADQYDNPANPQAHVEATGPEIWEQTQGRVTHFVAGIGTGGTITGTARYLKQASAGSVRVIGADPHSSVYGGGDGSPYAVEAVGHYLHPETARDVWPLSYDEALVDRVERIGDRESITTVHRLAREEGLLVGGSSGTAVAAALRVARDAAPSDLVVVIAPDSGRGYLSRYFNDEWLLAMGFQDGAPDTPVLGDLAAAAGAPLAIALPATAIEALAVVASRGSGLEDGLALVVLNRTGGDETWAVPDVAGVLPLAELRALPDDEPLGPYLRPLPSTAGSGEAIAEADARLDPDQRWIPVLHDGRIAAVVARSDLARSHLAVAAAVPGIEEVR
ncbi:PLP-dependent cysteine synthase family protein [Actinospica robiniae]|uniref:PLP-dependent cysteine synthase family protein n=1 Tax=Actinospica robiniae TaxID=304901 RepID=UPI00040BF308|nr:pyridoxal-phosphate dependent enzyme [Actinospica robiniae]